MSLFLVIQSLFDENYNMKLFIKILVKPPNLSGGLISSNKIFRCCYWYVSLFILKLITGLWFKIARKTGGFVCMLIEFTKNQIILIL